jgi:hypothetical protein
MKSGLLTGGADQGGARGGLTPAARQRRCAKRRHNAWAALQMTGGGWLTDGHHKALFFCRIFLVHKNSMTLKIEKHYLPDFNFFEKFWGGTREQYEQFLFLVHLKIWHGFWIINPGK